MPYRLQNSLRDAWSVRIRVLATCSGPSAVCLIVPARDDHQVDKCPTEHVAAYKANNAPVALGGQ